MRHIGSLQDEAHARVFGDFLVTRGVHNKIERETEGNWSVWVYEEDQIPGAQAWLVQFRAAPNAPEFSTARAEAARVRKAEAESLAAFDRRIRTRRSIFPKLGGYGLGLLTSALIVACLIVGFATRLGSQEELLRRLFISDPQGLAGGALAEVRRGEVWRLLTPIFIHFGLLHLFFNMVWLYQLGSMIEARQSSLHLALLVGSMGLGSNLAQYGLAGTITFGGMSGVVYGLAGYAWIRGKHDRASGLGLDSQSVTILLVWLVFCYTGLAGSVGNTAHLTGLAMGMAWGWTSARFASRRPGV